VKAKKIILAIAGAVVLALGLAACSHASNPSGQQQENQQQQSDTNTYETNQPIPHFQYSDYRQTAISVEAIQALGEQTTSFFFNLGVRNPIFSCPSLGSPFPNTAELSNPDQVENDGYPQGGAAVTIGQMDPNGVYSPSSSSGTYVICVNARGQQYAQYWEGDVDSVSGPATWDDATGQIVVTGQPTMPKCAVTATTTASGTRKAATTCTK
jgi:hypothetical protein